MEEITTLIKEVLEKGYLMSLGTVDDNGPWVSDVIYVHDDLALYWLSHEGSRHSKAIHKNSKVAVTITLTNKQGENDIGIQLEGAAKKVEKDLHKIAVAHRLKRGKQPPKENESILDPGEYWYELKPSKIELIYGPKWGFNKKILNIDH